MFDPDSDVFKQHIAVLAEAARKIIGGNVLEEKIEKFAKDHDLNPNYEVDAHVLRVLCKHHSDDISDIKITIDHDGADEYGFKSNLYTMIIQYTEHNNIYESEWYREEWYDNNIQYYEQSKQVKLIGTTYIDQC